jgi:hypothetical protein
VSSEKQNTLAAGVGALKIFEAFVDNYLGNIFAGVAGEKADFGKLPPEGNKFSTEKSPAFGEGHFRKRDV